MQRQMTGQHRNSSRLLIPRQVSSFVFTPTIDLTPLRGVHPQDPVTLRPGDRATDCCRVQFGSTALSVALWIAWFPTNLRCDGSIRYLTGAARIPVIRSLLVLTFPRRHYHRFGLWERDRGITRTSWLQTENDRHAIHRILIRDLGAFLLRLGGAGDNETLTPY